MTVPGAPSEQAPAREGRRPPVASARPDHRRTGEVDHWPRRGRALVPRSRVPSQPTSVPPDQAWGANLRPLNPACLRALAPCLGWSDAAARTDGRRPRGCSASSSSLRPTRSRRPPASTTPGRRSARRPGVGPDRLSPTDGSSSRSASSSATPLNQSTRSCPSATGPRGRGGPGSGPGPGRSSASRAGPAPPRAATPSHGARGG